MGTRANSQPSDSRREIHPSTFADFPAEKFPIRMEALNPQTGEVVWSQTVKQPCAGRKPRVRIPSLRVNAEFGRRLTVRLTFGDGEVVDETVIGRTL